MALKGNLSTTPLAEIFQTLTRGHSTGLLRVQSAEGSRFIEFQNGVISLIGRDTGAYDLGDLLLARGKITPEKLNAARRIQVESGLRLSQVLLEMSFVPSSDLEEIIHYLIVEEVCELFCLATGEFNFVASAAVNANAAPGAGVIRLKIDPATLAAEVAGRTDAWKAIEARVSSLALLFRMTPEGLRHFNAAEKVSPEAQIVQRYLQDGHSIEYIVHRSCLGRLPVNRIILELQDAKLVVPTPVALYLDIAVQHLANNELPEAERIARQAQRSGDETVRVKAAEVLAKIAQQRMDDKAPKAPAGGAQARKNQPDLLLHRRTPLKVWVAAGVLLLVAAGAAFYFLWFQNGSVPAQASYKRLEAAVSRAEELAGAGKYAEALQVLNDFRDADPEVKKAAGEQRNRLQLDIESKLAFAIAELLKTGSKGSPEELCKAAEDVERFEGVQVFSPKAQADYQKTKPMLAAYKAQSRLAGLKSRLSELQASAASRGPDELIEAYTRLLADEPPEEIAAAAREKLAELAKQRSDGKRSIERGKELAALGDAEGARAGFERAKKALPHSALEAEAQQELDALHKREIEAQTQLERIEILCDQKQWAKAREAFIQLRAGHAPQQVIARGMELLQRQDDAPEDELALALTRAGSEADVSASRAKVLEVLEKYPFSKAAATAKLCVLIISEPAGADVLDGTRTLGQTPLTVEVPATGLARLTFKLRGYEIYEWVGNDFRTEKLTLDLQRLQTPSRPKVPLR